MADLTPTTLQNIRVKIAQIWAQSKNTKPEFRNSPITLQGLLENQTALVSEDFQTKGGPDGKCVVREVTYLRPESDALPTISGTTVALDCLIPDGNGVDSFKQEYKTNIHFKDVLMIDDDDCGNDYSFDELVARGLGAKMALFCDAINRFAIGILDANAQTITPGNEETGTIGVGGDTIEWSGDRYRTDDDGSLISEWETVAISEELPANFLILDGKNLNTQIRHGEFQAFSDDQRTTKFRYSDGLHELYRDIKVLQAVTGDKATFLVDQNSYAFYSNKLYPETLTTTGDTNNTLVFSVPLTYMDYMGQMRELTYNTVNGTEKAYINVRYQKVCSTSSNTDKGQVMTHKWELSFSGMFDLAPAVADAGGFTKNGIVKMVQV